MPLTIINWNVQWAGSRSPRGSEFLRRSLTHSPEIICFTEANTSLQAEAGHVLPSEPDYGYPIKDGRRKALLWSKEHWSNLDSRGLESMPPGRFVSGKTRTSNGQVTVIGVCIPWYRSRFKGTEVKHRMWEDHEQYLEGLS